MRRLLAGDGVDHPTRLHLTAIGPSRKRRDAVLQGKRIFVAAVHQPVGIDLLGGQAGVAGVRALRAAQRADIELDQAFLVRADDTVIETVELVARRIHGIADQFDLGGIDPAAVALELRKLGPHQIAARVVRDRYTLTMPSKLAGKRCAIMRASRPPSEPPKK